MRKCSQSTIWPSSFAHERTDRGRTQQLALHMSAEQAAANAHRCGGALGFCTLRAPLPVWRARAINKTTKLRAGRRISRTNHMRAGSPPGEQAGAAIDCSMASTVFPCCPSVHLPPPSQASATSQFVSEFFEGARARLDKMLTRGKNLSPIGPGVQSPKVDSLLGLDGHREAKPLLSPQVY